MSSTPFNSFDATAGDTFTTFPDIYGGHGGDHGDEVDEMLSQLAAEVSDESFGATGARTIMNFDASEIWEAFVPLPLINRADAQLGTPVTPTGLMALAIAKVFESQVGGVAGGWSDNMEDQNEIIDKAVRDSMFRPKDGLEPQSPMIALRWARSRRDLMSNPVSWLGQGSDIEDLEAIVKKIFSGGKDWTFNDVDDIIQDVISKASRLLAEMPADQNMGITSEIKLSEGDINELAVILWLANEMAYESVYRKIAHKVNALPEVQDHILDQRGPAPKPKDSMVFDTGYEEISVTPPTSAGFTLPRPQTILGIGYLLSVGGPMFQALFGKRS